MDENRRSRPEGLGNAYAEGYFHGSNTGSRKESYGERHSDRRPWLNRLKGLISSGQPWLELGCSYSLLLQSRQENLPVFGCHISHYALLHRGDILNYLVQG